MAKIKINGKAFVITSGVKFATLEKLQRYAPETLETVDKETKDVIFAIATGKSASVSPMGIVFNDKNTDGFARVTIAVTDTRPVKEYVTSEYSLLLVKLNTLEENINAAYEQLEAKFTAVAASIVEEE